MMLCVASAATVLALEASSFTLGWTHSVERIRWEERWEVTPLGLRPTLGRVEASGAGMEVPEGAIFQDGAWQYVPALLPQREVWLAASGMTGSGWRLCVSDSCHELGASAEAPIRLWSAESCERG